MENISKGNKNELFNKMKFKFGEKLLIINNENELFEYINNINDYALIFENKYRYKYEKEENSGEKNRNKFIPLFFIKNDSFYESLSGNIINTISPKINRGESEYNNVFILNNDLEENKEFCFEIKLGHGFWDNIIRIKNNENIFRVDNLKMGLLKLNGTNLKQISDHIVINHKKKIEFYSIKANWEGPDLFSKDIDTGKNKKFEEYKKSIYYSINMNNLKIPIIRNSNNKDGYNAFRLIQKNDIIGIVFNNKSYKDFIEIKLYINGTLIISELVFKQELNLDNKNFDLDDDFEVEKIKKNADKNYILVPFIELGDNKTIIIKDKAILNNEINDKIISNEKIEYLGVYNSFPLNNFPEEILELQNITKAYLEILVKFGSKILSEKNKDINEKFKYLINFIKNYSFKNRIVLKAAILEFLLSGIDIAKGNTNSFKENIRILFYIIKYLDSSILIPKENRSKLLESIIRSLIEVVMENNCNFLDIYKLEQYNQNEIENFKKSKFILCFLLFDKFMKENKDFQPMISDISLFKYENDIFNFCYAVFNSCYYFDSANTPRYIEQFYSQNNKFDKLKFLDDNFRKYNDQKLYNNLLEDYEFIMQFIVKEFDINTREKTRILCKFIYEFCKSDDNLSIVNLIIIQLIRNYFLDANDLDKSEVKKIIKSNYIEMYNFKLNDNKNKDKFYGKNYLSQNNDFSSIIIDKEFKKKSLIFELIIKCISNYYEIFQLKEKEASDLLEQLSDKNKNYKDFEIYKINHMVEFYRIIYYGNFYLHMGYFINHLMKFLNLCIQEKYLDILPYYSFLQNILFSLDLLSIRCTFIDKNILIEKNEAVLILSIIDKVLIYVTSFLGEALPNIKESNFTSKEKFEELVSLNIKILQKVLCFEINIIKNTLPKIKKNLVLTFKNLSELYRYNEYKILYQNINNFIDFLYNYEDNKRPHIDLNTKNLFFTKIMSEEINDYKNKEKEEKLARNNYIERTMYYSFFIIIYKRIKILRESLDKIINNNLLFQNNIFYLIQYLIKFSKSLYLFYNFLTDNKLDIFNDLEGTCFLKINSFICKTFKLFHTEKSFQKFQDIYKEDPKLFEEFFSNFFFLLSYLLLQKDKNNSNYYYQMAQNREGFYFEKFKNNFEMYLGYPECRAMIEFLDILSNNFKKLCSDEDVSKKVNDNSFDLDERDECPICLEYISDKDVHLNPCNHVYHLECLKKMIEKKITRCSLCKRPITGIKEDPNFKIGNSNSLFSQDGGNNFFYTSNNLFVHNDNNQRNNIFLPRVNIFSSSNNEHNNNYRPPGLFSNNNGIFGNPINFGGSLFG